MTNRGHDRSHLLEMAQAAKAVTGSPELIALADRDYYEGEQIRGCAAVGITPMVPRLGATHFRTRELKNVATETSLTILAYNMKRAIAVAGVASTLKAITG